MKSEDGFQDYSESNDLANLPPSLNSEASPPVLYCAWSEIQPDLLIPGESFQDPGRMIYSLPSTPSERLDPKLIKKQNFVARNLSLRHGDTHLPLKPENY